MGKVKNGEEDSRIEVKKGEVGEDSGKKWRGWRR